jgi:hypothetical protein
MLVIIEAKKQRGAARMLKVNPGTVNHIKANTRESWTHVTLTPKMLAKIELLAEFVKHDADLSAEIKAEMDHVMELDAQLTTALHELKRKIRRL